MDIKSKKFNDRFAVRVCAFILCVLMFVSGIIALYVIVKNSYNNDPFGYLSNKDYPYSNQFENDMRKAVYAAGDLFYYGSEEAIKKGDFVDPDIEKYKVGRYYNAYIYDNLSEIYLSEGETVPEEDLPYYIGIESDIEEEEGIDYYEPKPYDKSVREQVLKDYETEVNEYAESLKKAEIESQLTSFAEAKNALEGFTYYVSDGNKVVTDIFGNPGASADVDILAAGNKAVLVSKGADAYYNVDGERLETAYPVEDDTISNIFSNVSDTDDLIEPGSLSLFIGFDDTHYTDLYADYSDTRAALLASVSILAGTLLISLILLIYLIVVTGRKDSDGNVKLYYMDKMFTEIQVAIFSTAVLLTIVSTQWLGIFDVVLMDNDEWVVSTGVGSLILWGLILLVLASVALWFFLSMVRMIKAHIFLKSSLIVLILKNLYIWVRAAFSRVNPMGKFVLIIAAACLLSMIRVLAPVMIILLLGFGYRWIRKYTAVKKGVDEVTNGNLEYRIPVDEKSANEFDQLARKINTISQASNKAIQNELKNQRLKTDLISNVSHDLKTPLTSIITYTDLLKKEGLDSPEAKYYLSVIDDKSQRLKTLTEDLFQAAKASSGSIPVKLEKVDILALINQSLAEFCESFDERGLEIIVNAHKEKYYVNGDGQLLWRVVENLFGNVSKYALGNSRVYIDISERTFDGKADAMVLFEMKNISEAALNIPEEVLMERFIRGDESRTTEGSGLGLAIAKDLVRLQNGIFELKIDGDLFKSTVMLEVYNEEKAEAANAEATNQADAERKMYSNQNDDMPQIKYE